MILVKKMLFVAQKSISPTQQKFELKKYKSEFKLKKLLKFDESFICPIHHQLYRNNFCKMLNIIATYPHYK